MRAWLQALCVLLSAIAAAAPLAAQDTPEAAQVAKPPPLGESLSGQAKLEYDAGRLLYDVHDYTGALLKFEHAFEHAHDLRLLWNMAACEQNLRHYARTYQLLERYRREGEIRMAPEHLAQVNEIIQAVLTLISKMQLVVDEPGATVFVDDRPVGRTPLPNQLWVDLGERTIRVSKPGFKDEVLTREITGGSEIAITITLARQLTEGHLQVSAEPNAAIRVDGRQVGLGQWGGNLLAGEHTVRVTAPDKLPYDAAIVLNAGQSRSLQISLQANPHGGVPGWVWASAGVLAAGGLATGAYFLFRGGPSERSLVAGTLDPGWVDLGR